MCINFALIMEIESRTCIIIIRMRGIMIEMSRRGAAKISYGEVPRLHRHSNCDGDDVVGECSSPVPNLLPRSRYTGAAVSVVSRWRHRHSM